MDRSNTVSHDRTGSTPHAHVLGADLRGLAGVAEVLSRRGMRVTASVVGGGAPGTGPDPVGGAGRARAWPVLRRRPWGRGSRLLVHGPEVGRTHPVRLGALRRGVPQATREEWLAGQVAGRFGVVFAGGRDASLAAAMTACALLAAGRDPSAVLQTPTPQLGGRARVGPGEVFILDWPGEPAAAAALSPGLAVLLGGEHGPGQTPGACSETLRALSRGAGGLDAVLALGHPSAWPEGAGSGVEWLSLRQGADWWGTDLREDSGRFRFRIFHRGRYVMEVRLRAPGLRPVVAALAATAVCARIGLAAGDVRSGLEEFAGLARGFETRGSFRGVTLIDDDADDAGSVYDTLALARRAYRGRRLVAVYSGPRGVSGPPETHRFVAAFALADRVTLTGGLADGLARALADAGQRVRWAEGPAGAVAILDRQLEPGDVLVTLGAEDVGTIADAFLRRLPRDRPGR